MPKITKGLTAAEIRCELERLDENIEGYDNDENPQVIIIPPDPDEMTDEDEINENEVEEEIIREVAGTYEIHQEDDDDTAHENDNAAVHGEDADVVASSVSKAKKKGKKIIECKWEKTSPKYSEEMQRPSANSYDTLNGYAEKTVEEMFELMFSNDLIDYIIEQSILYARQKKDQTFIIDRNEFKVFIGILLVSGYHKLPQEDMYWEQLPDAGVPLVNNAMSRARFREVKKYLHLSDNTNIDKSDKMAKLRPYLNKLKSNYQQFGVFDAHLSIDEMMVKYYGMHPAKQFMRGKPIKFGYKFWCLCSFDGYLYNFDPYLGKGQDTSTDPLGQRVISMLTDVLPSDQTEKYEVFFDNFFTNIETMKLLKNKNIKATGTIRENRTKQCPVMNSKEFQKKDRGSIDFRFDTANEILLTKWNDNKAVSVATNYSYVYPTATAKRYSQKQKKHITLPMPKCIAEYNKYMGGVDLIDKQVSLYRIRIRGKKWWFPIFTQFLDISVVNCWRIYQKIHPNETISLLEARRKIVLSYLSKSSKRKRPGPQRNSISEGRVSKAIRFDEGNHLIQPIPTQRRCAHCGKKVTRICSRCNVPLHAKCFAAFHTE